MTAAHVRGRLAGLAVVMVVAAACSSSAKKVASGGNGSTTTAAPAAPKISQGVDATTIKLGLPYTLGANETTAQAGVQAAQLPEGKRSAQAMVDWVNNNGGIAGRKVVPVYWENKDKPASIDAQAQAECAHFTQDNHVFAVLSGGTGADSPQSLIACLATHNTPLVVTNDTPYDQQYYDKYDQFLYTPGSLNQDRVAKAYVMGLKDAGFFDSGARLGLITADLPEWHHAVDSALKPALSGLGLSLGQEVYLSGLRFDDFAAQAPNVILKFKQAKIDHVLFLEHGAGISFSFIGTAASQKYFPRYGLTSYMYPDTQRQNQPAAALKASVGVGFIPDNDVATAQLPAPNDNKKLCLDVERKAGEVVKDQGSEETLATWCDAFFFFKAAMDKAKDFTPASMQAGVEALGTSYQAPNNFLTSFGPHKHDGIGGARTFAFDQGCACFKYTADVKPIT